MKKLITGLFALLFSLTSVQAQRSGFDIDNVVGGANAGWASPKGEFKTYAQGGISYNAFIGYKLNDNLSVGLQYGEAILGGNDSSGSTGLLGINAFGLSNYQVKGWYSPLDGDYKPYVSLGLGLGRVEEPSLTVGPETIKGKSSLGFGADIELGVSLNDIVISYGYVLGGKGPKDGEWNDKVANLPMNYTRISVGYFYNF